MTTTTQREADERAKFEAWFRAKYPEADINCQRTRWEVWQARAAIDHSASPAPLHGIGRAALNEFIDRYCLNKPELVSAAESAFYWFNKCAVEQAAPEAPASEQQAEKVSCPECSGTGSVMMEGDCSDCNGKGYDWEPVATTASASGHPDNGAEYLAPRLLRVAKLAGVQTPEHWTHDQVVEFAPTLLGEIARALQASHAQALSREADGQQGVSPELHAYAVRLDAEISTLARAPLPDQDRKIDAAFFVKEFDAAMSRANEKDST